MTDDNTEAEQEQTMIANAKNVNQAADVIADEMLNDPRIESIDMSVARAAARKVIESLPAEPEGNES